MNRKSAGLVFDTFHNFKGGSRLEDLKAVRPEKIFLVHLLKQDLMTIAKRSKEVLECMFA